MAVAVVALVLGAPSARAAIPDERDGAEARHLYGYDISWPQCDQDLPDTAAFVVVGVNGGTAANSNPCLAEQLRWASAATTASAAAVERVQLYLNTANPGEVLEEYLVTTWPTDNIDGRGLDSFENGDISRRNPYGRCLTSDHGYRAYRNDLACSWQYGWNRALEAVDLRFAPAAALAQLSPSAADYTWWLDVETMNSWQQDGARARERNAAALEGMAQFLQADGATEVGLYSTHYQWRQIVGEAVGRLDPAGHVIAGNLIGVSSWIAGASDSASAQRRCLALAGLTGGRVIMVQYIADGLDHNVRCR
jgi:hypothetical protein